MRTSVCAQGYFLHKWNPHDLWFAHARKFRAALRRNDRRTPRRCERRDDRQGEHGRVRDGLVEREQLFRAGAQSLGRHARAGRIVGRFCCRRRRRHRAIRDRHRYRRFDPAAGRVLRYHRPEADLRPRVALGHDRVRIEPGLRRRARAQRRRLRARARRDCRPRSARRDQHAAAGRRLRRRFVHITARNTNRRGARIFRRRCRGWCRRGGKGSAGGAGKARRGPRRHFAAACGTGDTGLLRHRAGRGVEQSRPLRRRALRPPLRGSGVARRPVLAQPRRRLRRRGQAPHPDRHLRAVGRLLRCVLPARAACAPPDRERFLRGVQAGRPDRRTDRADGRIQARRKIRRSARDVRRRRQYGRREPRRPAGDFDSRRLQRRTCRSACN